MNHFKFSKKRGVPGIYLNLSHPAIVYTIVWISALELTNLRLTINLIAIHPKTAILVFSNIVSFFVVYCFIVISVTGHRFRPILFVDGIELNHLHTFVKNLLKLWAVGTLVEIVVGHGLPLLWLITGDPTRTYQDFGIPTIHGFLTALYMFSTTALFLDYRLRRDKRKLLEVILLLIWPILEVNRGALVWTLLQILGVFVVSSRIRLRSLLKVIFLIILFVIIFGAVGDLRLGEKKSFINCLISPNAEFFRSMPSGFHWVYIYITSAINNLNFSINDLHPLYRPYYSLMSLVPTFIRDIIFGRHIYPLELENSSFTMSTIYASFLKDFGMWGALSIVALIQIPISLFYVYARRFYIWAIIAYAVLFQVIVLSIFTDTFTSLVTIFQCILALYCRSPKKRYLKLHFEQIDEKANRFKLAKVT